MSEPVPQIAAPQKGRILLLGGAAEAYILAEQLAALGVNFINSLAGRTHQPRLPAGPRRIGGFSAEGGLAAYIRRENISLIIDATHPYAARISAKAQAAAIEAAISYWRLERPLWQQQRGDIWLAAADEAEAAALIPPRARAFLALGRQYLAPFAARRDCHFFARMIEPPDLDIAALFQHLTIITGRPQNEAEEAEFLRRRQINCLICRNSGAAASYGKIAAARALACPVIMIARPRPPMPAGSGFRCFSDCNSIVKTLLNSAY